MSHHQPGGNRRNGERRQHRDRRDIPRYPAESAIRIMPAGEKVGIWEGTLTDASATGAKLLLNWEPLADVLLLIEVRSPGHACFNLSARVIWCEPAEQSGWHHVGCGFLQELTDPQAERLHAIAACYHG